MIAELEGTPVAAKQSLSRVVRWRNLLRLSLEFWIRRRWSLRYDRAVGAWIATRDVNGTSVPLVVRSFRELRRWYYLDKQGHREDLVFDIIVGANDLETIYDVGASNGIYGFAANGLHGCNVVFVEPFLQSVLSIIQTRVAQAHLGYNRRGRVEVVQAGATRESGLAPLLMHGLPSPGETASSVGSTDNYHSDPGERGVVKCSQWVATVSLDDLVFVHDLPPPTIVKIDIDGLEKEAIASAQRILKERLAQAWIIEINNQEDVDWIEMTMAQNGYRFMERQVHHPDSKMVTGDWFFVREEMADAWAESLQKIRRDRKHA